MNKKEFRSSLLLVLTALIWGSTFVAQKEGMEYIGPFTFGAVRMFLGGLALLPVVIFLGSYRKKDSAEKKIYIIQTVKYGIICGAILFAASSLQQYGMVTTSPGNAGFITSLYIVFVPVLGIFLKRKTNLISWLCVAAAAVGFYLLSVGENFSICPGDLLCALCALAFSIHILFIDHVSAKVDGVMMSCVQFLTAGLLSVVPMLIWEKPEVSMILACKVPILYSALLSCGIGYTLQIIAQKHIRPVLASLLMSLEALFAALAGWLILHDTMSAREITGCIVIFISIISAQTLPSLIGNRTRKS